MEAKVYAGPIDAIANRLSEDYPSPATITVLVVPVTAEADERTAQCLARICQMVESTMANREAKIRKKLIDLLMDFPRKSTRQSQPADH